MSKIKRVEFNLDRDNMLTKIEVLSATPEEVELLCNELIRCCECCNSTIIKKSGQNYHIIPVNDVAIVDFSTTYDFICKQFEEFVDDISFVQDKSANNTLSLLDALHEQLTTTKLNSTQNFHACKTLQHEISEISTLIDYINQEGWDCTCEDCKSLLLINDILLTHKTTCFECQKNNYN